MKNRSLFIPLIVPLIIGLFTPMLAFLYFQVAVKGVSIGVAAQGILEHAFADEGLFLKITMVGMIPFLILSGVLMIFNKYSRPTPGALAVLSFFGLSGTVIPMVYLYLEIWQMPGLATMVVFVFSSLYCTITMLLGTFIGWVFVKRRG